MKIEQHQKAAENARNAYAAALALRDQTLDSIRSEGVSDPAKLSDVLTQLESEVANAYSNLTEAMREAGIA